MHAIAKFVLPPPFLKNGGLWIFTGSTCRVCGALLYCYLATWLTSNKSFLYAFLTITGGPRLVALPCECAKWWSTALKPQHISWVCLRCQPRRAHGSGITARSKRIAILSEMAMPTLKRCVSCATTAWKSADLAAPRTRNMLAW